MKRNHIFSVILFLFTLPMFARGMEEKTTLTVYCYDSFSSEWGAGPIIAQSFTEATGIEVEFYAPGDALTVLNQLIFEKDNPRADVVVGLDDSMLSRALEEGILQAYRPSGLDRIPGDLVIDVEHRLIPYDYGHFAINYDSQRLTNPPKSLEDLTEERFSDKLILMDPRTSSPGLGFLLWTVGVYGDDWQDYWYRLKDSILTITDGWSQGYSLYTSGEAPLVLSYASSPFYHAEYEDTNRYKAAEFSDGHVRQIEGMAVVAGNSNREAAEAFIDFMLERESQKTLVMSNIMQPVIEDIELPKSFDAAIRPSKTVDVSPYRGDVDALIDAWVEIFTR